MRYHMRLLFVFCTVLTLGTMLFATPGWPDASTDYQQGIALYEAGDYVRAIKVFQRVVASDAQLAGGAQHRVGLCYYSLGTLDDAIPAFKAALAVARPEETALLLDIRGDLARSCIRAKLWDEASSVIQQIALGEPEAGGHLMFMSCVAQRDYERAAAALIYSLVTTPDVAHIGSAGLPSWLLSTGDRKSVSDYVKSFCDAVAKGATITASPVIKADLQAMLEKAHWYDGAMAVIGSTFSEADTPAEAAEKLYKLGSMQYRAGRFDTAAETLGTAARLVGTVSDEQRASALYLQGLSFEQLGDLESASGLMNDLIQRYPNTSQALVAQRHLAVWAKASPGNPVGEGG